MNEEGNVIYPFCVMGAFVYTLLADRIVYACRDIRLSLFTRYSVFNTRTNYLFVYCFLHSYTMRNLSGLNDNSPVPSMTYRWCSIDFSEYQYFVLTFGERP